jgi:GTP-binding protein
MSYYQRAEFSVSAPDIKHLSGDEGIEVAFAGRSNAGKSSALNRLTRQKQLARTSKTPGRTQLISVFSLSDQHRLIDLPGYGFAQVPLAVKKKWQASLSEYLEKRQSLRGLVILMDIRHPFKQLDQQLVDWAVNANLSILLLLTKSDKLKSGKRKQTLMQVREASLVFSPNIQTHTFSALTGDGLDQLEAVLNQWFDI